MDWTQSKDIINSSKINISTFLHHRNKVYERFINTQDRRIFIKDYVSGSERKKNLKTIQGKF